MNKLDKLLVKKCITEHELDHALSIKENTSSSLPDILLSEGYINPYRLYSTLAEFNNTPFADLLKNPCNDDIVKADERDEYLRLKAIPWKKEGKQIVIATCEVTDEVKNWASEKYDNYSFAITSPFDINNAINELFQDSNNKDARDKLWSIDPKYSAKNLFKGIQSKIFLLGIVGLITSFILFPKTALPALFLITSIFYAATLALKTVLFLIGIIRNKRTDEASHILDLADKELPVYTILIPLYQEEKVLKKLTDSIKALDYPKSKLDVKLIVESDDNTTIEAIKALKCERIFEMVKVPYSLPRTKPKACNYALKFARGKFITIYDAEDMPDPLQLKKALYVFYNESPEIACVQSKLNYFNRGENWLSKLFSIEYSNLFDFLLPGLEAMKLPIPLGGTSNHFRTQTLNELYAWDPYNVTEDADLGIRIAQKGWKCKIIESTTMEECPISISAWIRQRSRWIKGHMQTYFVHMRQPFELYKKVGIMGFMGVQFFLGAPALIFLISPIMWSVWALFVSGTVTIPNEMPIWFDDIINFSTGVLICGIFLQIFYATVSIKSNNWKGMLLSAFLFPFYWILHSAASFKSLWQLITRPYYWEKTNHGVTKVG